MFTIELVTKHLFIELRRSRASHRVLVNIVGSGMNLYSDFNEVLLQDELKDFLELRKGLICLVYSYFGLSLQVRWSILKT